LTIEIEGLKVRCKESQRGYEEVVGRCKGYESEREGVKRAVEEVVKSCNAKME